MILDVRSVSVACYLLMFCHIIALVLQSDTAVRFSSERKHKEK